MSQKRFIVATSRQPSDAEKKSGMALEGMLADVDALGALKKERREEFAREARKLRGQQDASGRGQRASRRSTGS